MKREDKASHWGRSLKQLKWDEKEERTESQKLISTTIHEWYAAKHREISKEEMELINAREITFCRRCGSANIIKRGKDQGIQRYYCNDCHHSFNAITNTIFEDRKIRSVNG